MIPENIFFFPLHLPTTSPLSLLSDKTNPDMTLGATHPAVSLRVTMSLVNVCIISQRHTRIPLLLKRRRLNVGGEGEGGNAFTMIQCGQWINNSNKESFVLSSSLPKSYRGCFGSVVTPSTVL